MAKVNTTGKVNAGNENVEQTVSKSEQFYNKYKKILWGTIIVVIVIFAAALGFDKFIRQPKCAEAAEQMYPAEQSFIQGNYEVALNGDGNILGFTQIISDYGSNAGAAVYFYAGVCELQLGNYEEALSYLKNYKGKDSILAARAEACKGDAYVGLEDYKSAVACFAAAAARADNNFAASYLVKEGVCQEKLGDKAAALKCYKSVKDKYPQSIEGYDIDKYITRVSE